MNKHHAISPMHPEMRRRSCLVSAVMTILLALLFSAQPEALAETWLKPTEGIHHVTDLSVAPDGSMYISQSAPGMIQACDHDGTCRQVGHVDFPSAVAVDAAGRLYVGKGRYATPVPPYTIPGEVRIYSVRGNDLDHQASLGIGAGEFVNPTDIYIDRSGKIYVADSDAHNVKVFNADGSRLVVIGQQGIGDGFFNMPLALAVDEADGDIYVTDKQLVANSASGMVSGARVQVFNCQGEYLRGFGRYLPGELISPSDIALHDGKAYIADSYQNAVIVYDAATGLLKNVLQPPDGMLRMPVSLDISDDGMLYVASAYTGRLYRAGLADFVDLSVQPDTLAFEASFNGPLPLKQEMTLKNNGTGILGWTASADEPWITVDTTQGALNADAAGAVLVGVDQKDLAEGRYAGSVTVRTAGGTTETLAVTLTVVRPPVLSVTPLELFFEVENNIAPPSRMISVTLDNAAAGALWTAAAAEPWITIAPVGSGAVTGGVNVSVSAAGYAAGDYHGKVLISSDNAVGSPAEVAVTMRVKETGAIVVSTNCREAAFTIQGDNGRSFSGSGLSWSVSGVPTGSYRIEFQDLAGFLISINGSEEKVLARGGRIEFIGACRRLQERIVTVDNSSDPAMVRVYDLSGTVLQEFGIAGNRYHMQDVSSGDLDGDGTADIVTAAMKGSSDISVYGSTGRLLEMFPAFSGKAGQELDMADIDGDGSMEIIVLGKNGTMMKVFHRAGDVMADTGIDLKLDGQAIQASGDLDGDEIAEVVTAVPGNKTSLLIWRILAEQGRWDISLAGKLTVNIRPVSIAVGDIDGDGTRDIVLIDGKGGMRVVDPQGTTRELPLPVRNTCDMAVGDVDGDGISEIIVGRTNGRVTVFGKDGIERSEIRVHDRPMSCVRVSAGQFGY